MAISASALGVLSFQTKLTGKGAASPTATGENKTLNTAPHAAYTTFATPASPENNAAVDAVRNCLASAGWTVGLPIYAVGNVSAPLGWGYTGFQSHAVFIGNGVTGTVFTFYNPATDPIPSGFFMGYTVYPVPIAGSSSGSQLNMIFAINASGAPVGAAVASASVIDLTAKAPGTLGNGIVCNGNGSVTLGSNTTGGGWTMKSRTQFELFGWGNTARIILTATTGAPGQPNQMVLAATVGSDTVTMPCQQSGSWQMVAHDFGVVVISFAAGHGGNLYEFNGFFWADTLNLPQQSLVNFAAFVKQPANAGSSSSQMGFSDGMTVDMWLNATHTASEAAQLGWSLAAYHTEVGGGIADVNGFAVQQNPYVMLFNPAVGESRICGQLWNSFISSQPLPVLEQVTRGTTNYRVVASQNTGGPPACLIMASGEVNILNTPATNDPVTKNPVYISGTGNTVAGSTTTTGVLVMDPNGPSASLSWVGLTITINGTAATVLSVTGLFGLTYNPFVGANTGVPWAIALV